MSLFNANYFIRSFVPVLLAIFRQYSVSTLNFTKCLKSGIRPISGQMSTGDFFIEASRKKTSMECRMKFGKCLIYPVHPLVLFLLFSCYTQSSSLS